MHVLVSYAHRLARVPYFLRPAKQVKNAQAPPKIRNVIIILVSTPVGISAKEKVNSLRVGVVGFFHRRTPRCCRMKLLRLLSPSSTKQPLRTKVNLFTGRAAKAERQEHKNIC